MAKAVLISIRPEWVEKILIREKTCEVRKNVPKIAVPFKCYIYCTKPKRGKSHKYDAFALNGKPVECGGYVVAEFICDRIRPIAYTVDGFAGLVDCRTACMKPSDFLKYGRGGPLVGWHISNLKIYKEPKELSDFFQCQKCEGYGECKEHDYSCDGYYRLKRPPQSWCYVEEIAYG